MPRILPLLCLCVVLSTPLLTTAEDQSNRPDASAVRQWQTRKFGMFIHFGLYSTLGGIWKGKPYSGNYSEQIQSDAAIPEPEYSELAKTFNPGQWDPAAVVHLAREAGMQFIVLTAKHHDGFNMFGTRQTKFNIVEATPYGRDIVKSLADACAREHMPFGVYYSTIDWNYGDTPEHKNDNRISTEHEQFNAAQLAELMTGYGPLTEIWFDMGHPTKLQSRHFAGVVHRYQPNCMVSGRVWNSQGDFLEMGDDEIPDYILDEPWESPASIFKETWGYRSWQKRTGLQEKINEHIERLVKVVSRGGNYILNIGPKGDGGIVPYEADVLRGVGAWLKRNGEAIYETQPQPFRKLDFGYATVKENRLFLFVENPPANGKLVLPGMQNQITKAYSLDAPDASLAVTKAPSADPAIQFPRRTDFLPVVAVDFEGPLNVRQGPTLQPGPNGAIILRADHADHFFNSNGEGYYDSPTLRKQQWIFSLTRHGSYQIRLDSKPGKSSRALDVIVNQTKLSAIVYGQTPQTIVGEAELKPGADITLTVEPAAPAERGAILDIGLEQVILKPVH
jgi:alpha-L-fucosidase